MASSIETAQTTAPVPAPSPWQVPVVGAPTVASTSNAAVNPADDSGAISFAAPASAHGAGAKRMTQRSLDPLGASTG